MIPVLGSILSNNMFFEDSVFLVFERAWFGRGDGGLDPRLQAVQMREEVITCGCKWGRDEVSSWGVRDTRGWLVAGRRGPTRGAPWPKPPTSLWCYSWGLGTGCLRGCPATTTLGSGAGFVFRGLEVWRPGLDIDAGSWRWWRDQFGRDARLTRRLGGSRLQTPLSSRTRSINPRRAKLKAKKDEHPTSAAP